MTQFKLIATIVFLVLFFASVACNVVTIILLKNNEQRIELAGLKKENLSLKREAEINKLYIKEIKLIKKERQQIYYKIEEAETNEEIVNIISDIVNYNNFLVSDNNSE